MKIILKATIEKLGVAGDIVNVKNGFARNYLIPNNFASEATRGALKSWEFEKKAIQKREDAVKAAAQELAGKLEKVDVTIPVTVGDEDRMFGSVTSQQIADLIIEQGIEIDKRKIVLDAPIKSLGTYDVQIKLHPEVIGTIKVWVVKDQIESEEIEEEVSEETTSEESTEE
ncbi:MAG: 50S ribosomal protein L9 [Calditrichaeota bacterium]|nr:MAG: 50S ribosomal protein L9 [Calditrichota bacterium]